MPLNLLDLPAEVILMISESCDSRTDTSRLSRTSQYMNALFKPMLDKALVTDYHLDRLLIWASKTSNLPLARKLLEMGTDPNLTEQVTSPSDALRGLGGWIGYPHSGTPRTALHHACSRRQPEMAEILIKHGARVNLEEHRRDSLHFAVFKDSLDTIKVLFAHNVNIACTDESGSTALHQAACVGSQQVVEFLINNGAPINAADDYGRTPLHHAIDSNIENTQLLLKHGADVEFSDKKGWTPLFSCCFKGRLTAAKALLEFGANPNTPCPITRSSVDFLSPLGVSRNDAIIMMLLKHGADPNYCQAPSKDTALHRAASNGKRDVVRMLLEKGADVTALNGKEETPLLQAVKCAQLKRDPEIVKLLAEHDPDVAGMTNALHTAVLECYEDAVRILLERGADDRGCAAIVGHESSTALLLEPEDGAIIRKSSHQGPRLLLWAEGRSRPGTKMRVLLSRRTQLSGARGLERVIHVAWGGEGRAWRDFWASAGRGSG